MLTACIIGLLLWLNHKLGYNPAQDVLVHVIAAAVYVGSMTHQTPQ